MRWFSDHVLTCKATMACRGAYLLPLPRRCMCPHDSTVVSLLSTTASQQVKESIITMSRLFSFVTLSAIATASVLQQPLHDVSNSQVVINTKPLVSSEVLEGHITKENLLKRAKKLFEIAELGVADYNHPTRVIGSAGRHQLLISVRSLLLIGA